MQLPQLAKSIATKDKQKLYIFTGEEIAIMDIYIANIVKTFATTPVRVDTISEIYNKAKNNSILNKLSCFIVSNDMSLLEKEKMWADLESGKIQGQNIIILTYSNMDKRKKFYKYFSDLGTITEFEKLSPDVLVKYIQAKVNLNESACHKLITICDTNYNRILLELDKVEKIMNVNKVTPEAAFQYCLENKVFHIPVGDIIFEFVDAVCTRRAKKSYELWEKIKAGESPVKVLSLLYTNFRAMFSVKEAGNVAKICDFTGLTPWQVKLAKEKLGCYDVYELRKAVKIIRTAEKDIKRGLLDADIAIDFVLAKLLGNLC